jgi:hypothetical protein
MRRMRGALPRGLAAMLVAAFPAVARAGAWTPDQGQGVAILGATATSSDHALSPSGHVSDASSFAKTEIDFYAEYGIRDWLAAVVQGGFTDRHAGGSEASSFDGADITHLGARIRLWRQGDAVFSFQATQEVPGGSGGYRGAEVGNTGPATDLRLLAGYSFRLAGLDAFTDIETAYHLRSGRPPDEVRLDATLGVRVRQNLTLMAQSFNTISLGEGGRGFPATRYSKIEISAVYDLDQHWSVQLGAIGTVAGRNALLERGVTASLWRHF